MSVATSLDPTPSTDVAAIPGLVERVRRGFDSGRTRPLAWRLEQLDRLKALLQENSDRLVEALQADLGKPTLEAFTTDVAIVVGEIATARKQLKRWMQPEKVATPINVQPARSWIQREPLGVVLVIAPWNYPVQLLLLPVLGAIAAGNAVVMKPSEVSAHTSALLAELVPRYLDPEACVLVEGAVPETTALLAESFDHIFYTGGGRVARVVMRAAANHLTPVTLELGGKSPCIVDESAKLALAARRIAWGKFLNAGQTCIAPDYVLVHERHEQALVDSLRQALREFYGEDPKQTADFARIASIQHFRRLQAFLKDGEPVIGGQTDEEQRYIAPTVLRGVDPDSAVMSEEIFGPVLPVLPVQDVNDAVSFVRRREKPLALYLFTESAENERKVVEQTSSGGVCVNGTIWQVGNSNLPFGGVGPSGMGAYHGKASFECFSHRKAVVKKSTRFDLKAMYPPYGALKTKLVKKLI